MVAAGAAALAGAAVAPRTVTAARAATAVAAVRRVQIEAVEAVMRGMITIDGSGKETFSWTDGDVRGDGTGRAPGGPYRRRSAVISGRRREGAGAGEQLPRRRERVLDAAGAGRDA
ncbi:hypothetical protein GCM10020000_26510 [Streptomyces olivoverticillatus]